MNAPQLVRQAPPHGDAHLASTFSDVGGGSTDHAKAVLQELSRRIVGRRPLATTATGVVLVPVTGRFDIGDHVFAPGIDDCTPVAPAEVVAVGTRQDRPGVWCLVRHLREGAPNALIEEFALSAVHSARSASQGARADFRRYAS
jgi:hypothetical protein